MALVSEREKNPVPEKVYCGRSPHEKKKKNLAAEPRFCADVPTVIQPRTRHTRQKHVPNTVAPQNRPPGTRH